AIGCHVSVKPCSQDTILHRYLRLETSLYRLLLCQQAARAQSEPCGAQTPPHRVSGGEEGQPARESGRRRAICLTCDGRSGRSALTQPAKFSIIPTSSRCGLEAISFTGRDAALVGVPLETDGSSRVDRSDGVVREALHRTRSHWTADREERAWCSC